MTQTQERRHIQVNAHDDEVVIYAGQGSATDDTAPEQASDVPPSDTSEASEPSVETAPSAHTPSQGSQGEYRATTLEDLNSSKMSTTQKVIIILAVLGILAFILWYVILT